MMILGRTSVVVVASAAPKTVARVWAILAGCNREAMGRTCTEIVTVAGKFRQG